MPNNLKDDSKPQNNSTTQLQEEIDELLHRADALPRLDPRPMDEILDYDENGLPR